MSTMGAVSGLLINNDYIDIISNNIANASTVGYKSSKPIFFDMFTHSFYSSTNNGYGVGISDIIQNFNNGMLVETDRNLDLGIVQDGFFRVLDSQGHIHYTRDGQFHLDKNKNIINVQGMYLTGQNKYFSTNTFNNTSALEPINLQHAHKLREKPTSEITLKAILNRNTNTISNNDYADNNSSETEDYITHIGIYNKNGEKKQISISFKKQDEKTWKVNVDSDESNDEKYYTNKSFYLKFDSDGELISNKIFHVESNNPQKYENITLDLTGTIEQSDTNNSFEEYTQNGYPQGILKAFNIFSNGEIIAKYSNEQEQTIGRVLLSKFINPEKLKPESGNLWSATSDSGAEIIETEKDKNFGILSQRTLETSNVDLNKELINMIIAQRNYQSNAQSFKTEDKIINTLINLR